MTSPPPGLALVRAFAAAQVSAAVREELAGIQTVLKRTRAHVSWVPAPNIHCSLAFLGTVTTEEAALAAEALDEAARTCPPLTFTVEGLGTFGSAQTPRVVWAGTGETQALGNVRDQFVDLLRALSLFDETRPYRPHLTLGRVRSSRGSRDLLNAMQPHRRRRFGTVRLDALHLMQSHLDHGSAHYTVLHRAPLTGPAPGSAESCS